MISSQFHNRFKFVLFIASKTTHHIHTTQCFDSKLCNRPTNEDTSRCMRSCTFNNINKYFSQTHLTPHTNNQSKFVTQSNGIEWKKRTSTLNWYVFRSHESMNPRFPLWYVFYFARCLFVCLSKWHSNSGVRFTAAVATLLISIELFIQIIGINFSLSVFISFTYI